MKKLPPQWQQERLQRWLTHWSVDQALKGAKVPTQDENPGKLKLRSRPFDKRIRVGDIRVLSSTLISSECLLPRYVAVIREWGPGTCLVAPYSYISEPAVTGELDTGRDHFSLANLELWNVVITPDYALHALQKSWKADELTLGEQEEAWAVFRHITTGDDLPDELTERVGPPIHVENDPRICYQDEETSTFMPLREACRLF
jgi:hypothetical protein